MNKALKLLYEFLKNTTTISAKQFIQEMSKIPLFYTKSLADLSTYFEVFGREVYYELEEYVYNKYENEITSNQKKINTYKQIDNIIAEVIKNSTKSNDVINSYIKQELNACINANRQQINNIDHWYSLIKRLNITGFDIIVNNLIKEDFIKRKDFYYRKVKSWLNQFYERYLLNRKKENHNPIVKSLEELKNINQIGKEFDIDKQVVYEIDNSVKDKFTWIPGKFVTSDDGYGLHHSQQYSNLIEERRNNKIDKDRKDFISNARQPEDLSITLTDEEKQIPAVFGSYYFNNTVAIIEGKYLVSRGDENYNTVVELLKKKFTHIFDLSIENTSMKQESKLLFNKKPVLGIKRLMKKI